MLLFQAAVPGCCFCTAKGMAGSAILDSLEKQLPQCHHCPTYNHSQAVQSQMGPGKQELHTALAEYSQQTERGFSITPSHTSQSLGSNGWLHAHVLATTLEVHLPTAAATPPSSSTHTRRQPCPDLAATPQQATVCTVHHTPVLATTPSSSRATLFMSPSAT